MVDKLLPGPFEISGSSTSGRSPIREAALLQSLIEVTRILKAFSYTNQFGKTQRERLEKAERLIAMAGVDYAKD